MAVSLPLQLRYIGGCLFVRNRSPMVMDLRDLAFPPTCSSPELFRREARAFDEALELGPQTVRFRVPPRAVRWD